MEEHMDIASRLQPHTFGTPKEIENQVWMKNSVHNIIDNGCFQFV